MSTTSLDRNDWANRDMCTEGIPMGKSRHSSP